MKFTPVRAVSRTRLVMQTTGKTLERPFCWTVGVYQPGSEGKKNWPWAPAIQREVAFAETHDSSSGIKRGRQTTYEKGMEDLNHGSSSLSLVTLVAERRCRKSVHCKANNPVSGREC